MVTDAQVDADIAAGRRYAVSDEDAYEAFCEARGLPLDSSEADAAWTSLSDDELNEYVFPCVRDDLAD